MNLKPKIDKQDIKEKLIVMSVTTGIFLPARLLFYSYVSQYWGWSFGIVGLLAIVMFVLVRKNKLGRFGKIFEKQMARSSRGKIGKIYLAGLVGSLFVFSTCITMIDMGENYYHKDRELFYSIIAVANSDFYNQLPKLHITQPTQQYMLEAKQMSANDRVAFLKSHEKNAVFMGVLIFHTMNQIYSGWVAHFVIVGLVSAFEMLCLFFFYRKVFTKENM